MSNKVAQQLQLRDRLTQLKARLVSGAEPDLDDWLSTLELMSIYQQYFSEDELNHLPLYRANAERRVQWQALCKEANALHAAQSESAQQLARRWIGALGRDTDGNPEWLLRLSAMHRDEPSFQQQFGVSAPVVSYLTEAFVESKMQALARYLSDEEYAFLRAHYVREMQIWPALLIDLEHAIESGVAATGQGPGRALVELDARQCRQRSEYPRQDPSGHGARACVGRSHLA